MMKKRLFLLPLAALFGMALAYSYINPSNASITVSEVILQLTGSRGSFRLGINFTELIQFIIRLVPSFVFQALFGITLYKHYCIASVYVFSRMINRTRWYLKNIFAMALMSIIYYFAILIAAVITTSIRWELIWDCGAAKTIINYIIIWSGWNYIYALLVNVISIYLGSGLSFTIVLVIQTVLISSLRILTIFDDNSIIKYILMRINPITCLIFCLQTDRENLIKGIYFEDSILFVCVLSVAIIVLGGIIIKKRDLLISGEEG